VEARGAGKSQPCQLENVFACTSARKEKAKGAEKKKKRKEIDTKKKKEGEPTDALLPIWGARKKTGRHGRNDKRRFPSLAGPQEVMERGGRLNESEKNSRNH